MGRASKVLFLLLLISIFVGSITYLIVLFFSKTIFCFAQIYSDHNWELIYWTSALVFSTIFLGIVAAFQDIIRNFISSPRLKCELKVESPHCHLLNNTTYYFRFMIHNKGEVSAKNVNVVINDIRDNNNKLIGLSADNLRWSSEKIKHFNKKDRIAIGRIYWKLITPSTYQYCNLGSIDTPIRHVFDEGVKKQVGLGNLFKFAVYWRTVDRLYEIGEGIYTFKIVVGCENAKAVKMFYKIKIADSWYNTEDSMFKEGFKVLEEKVIK